MPVGQDVMISVYNIHRSPAVWDDPNDFRPERFPLDEPVPSEQTTNYRCSSRPFCLLHCRYCRAAFSDSLSNSDNRSTA